MEHFGWWIAAAAAVASIAALKTLRLQIVYDYQKGLLYRKGRLVRHLDAGAYWHVRWLTNIVTVDMRTRLLQVTGQELFTPDGLTIKVSAVAAYRVSDPCAAVSTCEDYAQALHVAVQLALREVVGTAAADNLLENRVEFGTRLLALAAPRVAEFGLALRGVEVKDIMFPGELKKVFAQVVKARKEGQAALERARGETAALRAMANAARMIDDNPNLLQLRILHAMGETAGATFVMGAPVMQVVPAKTAGSAKAADAAPEDSEPRSGSAQG